MQLNLKIVVFQLVLLAVQGVTYLLVQHTKRMVRDMECNLDGRIPLVPRFIFPYVLLWYPLIASFPLAMYHFYDFYKTARNYRRHFCHTACGDLHLGGKLALNL